MVVNDLLKVIYVPQKVFKEIIQNPRYLGAFIAMVLFVAAQIGISYTIASKSYVEQNMPTGEQGDLWTEHAVLWQANSGVVISNNYDDFINGTGLQYYGNNSIEFTVSDSNNIWLELNDLDGSVNCGADGFKNLSIRIKLVTPEVRPENVTLYLYSLSPSNFFYYDLTEAFSNVAVNVWNNITLPVGSGDWLSSSTAAMWENITGLKMEFAWASNSSITLRVEGLFFRGIFKTLLEVYGIAYLAFSALNAFTSFIFQWLLLTGLMYVIIKGLKGNVVWRPLMVAVGFALITMAVQVLIIFPIYMTLPNSYYPLEYLAGIPGEFDVVHKVILDALAFVSQVGGFVQIAVYMWTVALCAIITRSITGFQWKSLLVSGASFLLTIILRYFIIGV